MRVLRARHLGGARSGLASHRVAAAVLSGAAVGHDRVRDGTGWGHGALGHEHPAGPRPVITHASTHYLTRLDTGRPQGTDPVTTHGPPVVPTGATAPTTKTGDDL